jgi:phosphatidylserine/phosphatidylglycerophosphate/cardiolipin synthase-like enzyme
MTRPFTPIKLIGDGGVPRVAGQAAAQAVAHGQDLVEPEAFAPLRQNNQVRCFTTGEDYFKAVSAAMKGAKKSIFIAGWQINWDVELTPGERLIDILHERIQTSKTLRVFVMPWLSPKIGVNTFDLDTMLAIFQLNAGCATMQAMCCPTGPQSDYLGTEGAAFSHHQKMVVVDNETAYVGGIDLAYGRYDDNKCSLNPGKRSFNERYNPGVTGSDRIKPGEGSCLSTMDLLTSTLTAGKWNQGGNSAPGALAEFIEARMNDASRLALGAVDLVNRGAAIHSAAQTALVNGGATALRAGAAGWKAGANATAETAVGAANAVSSACAGVQIPDLYGGIKSQNVGAAPTSGVPDAMRNIETGARTTVNAAVDAATSLAHFLAPLNRLRVRPTPHSSMPDAVNETERLARAGLNTMIDGAAAVAGTAQQVAAQGRQVCVEIGPGVQRGVSQSKAALREGAHQGTEAVHNAKLGAEAGLNRFQIEIIEEITRARKAINDRFFALVALGDRKIDETIQGMSQSNLEAVLKRLMRLAKLIYAAQLALSWQDTAAHPLLMKKGTKSAAVGGVVLGSTQPRQPWQDVHAEIKGPAVDDVARNFIERWNAAQKSYMSEQTLADMGPLMRLVFGSGGVVRANLLIPAHLVPGPRPPQAKGLPTGVAVRVLRSAPHKMCLQEAQARGDKLMPAHEQREIQTQMVNLIKGATDFIYIENQFYQTGFGKPSIDVSSRAGPALTSGPMNYMYGSRMNRLKSALSSAGYANGNVLLPVNEIGKALGERIAQAVRRGRAFHVYMVLPVHPEGKLDDITVVGQIHWTMQSLVFAEYSLINLVRRAIAARKLCRNVLSDDAWKKALTDAGIQVGKTAPYEDVTEAQWSRYLTLLNLRTCEKVNGVVRTEQIYIHSKLLIVDDRHVILGSANINDRSQSGKRDTELAVMLFDSAQQKKTIGDITTTVNTLARKLRVDLWKKHFALTGANDIVLAATEMKSMIERPAAEATIKAIQALASTNANIYAETFHHVPWSKTNVQTREETGASIWPVCPKGASTEMAAERSRLMPFHNNFWLPSTIPVKAPEGIKGFFTKLPTNWTIGENNHPGIMSVMALTQNENRQQHPLVPDEIGDPYQTKNA